MFYSGEMFYEGRPSLEGGELTGAFLKKRAPSLVGYRALALDPRLLRQIDDIKNTQALLQQRQEAINKLKGWGINSDYLEYRCCDKFEKSTITKEQVESFIAQKHTRPEWADLGYRIDLQNSMLKDDINDANDMLKKHVQTIAKQRTQQKENAIKKAKEVQQSYYDKYDFRGKNVKSAQESARDMEKLLIAQEEAQAAQAAKEAVKEKVADVKDAVENIENNAQQAAKEQTQTVVENQAKNTAKEMKDRIDEKQVGSLFSDALNMVKKHKTITALVATATLLTGAIATKYLFDKKSLNNKNNN